MHCFEHLKALCHNIRHNSFLMSSLVEKWVQEVWAHPILWYSARECAEIECLQRKDFVDDRVEKLTILSYGQPKDENTDR